MLTITVGEDEFFDEAKEEFVNAGGVTLTLEHSLVSLSKWESEHCKPFITKSDKTDEEVFSYIEAMILTPDFPPGVISLFSQKNFNEVNEYINAQRTATIIYEPKDGSRSQETITSELIYYWMISFNIPMECETWHLNRLFTLIKVCSLKNSKPKKLSAAELAARNRAINEERLKKFNTTG